MRAVDDEVHRQPRLGECLFGERDRDRVVVGASAAAAQHEVAVAVAAGAHDGGAAFFVDAEESVRARGRDDGIDGHFQAAVGGILESDRGGQARGHLAVGLRFDRARADRRPRDEIAVVLRCDGIERLGGRRQPQLIDGEQELAGARHAHVDAEAVVEEGVVDVAFPAGGGARFLEVDAHHQHQGLGDFLGEGGEPLGVVEAGDGIVDGAGADDDEEPRIAPLEDVDESLACLRDRGRGAFTQRVLRLDLGRRGHGIEALDVGVFQQRVAHGSRRPAKRGIIRFRRLEGRAHARRVRAPRARGIPRRGKGASAPADRVRPS